jgi:hypothetical protein
VRLSAYRGYLIAALLFLSVDAAWASVSGEIVCSYAPSQSKFASGVIGAAGGAAASTAAVAQAMGLTVVTHSSGGLILTGAGGYVAGTLTSATAGTAIVGVGLVVGGAAVTIEMVCASQNHPEMVERVKVAAKEFTERSKGHLAVASTKAIVIGDKAKTRIKRISGDVFEYAYRRTDE